MSELVLRERWTVCEITRERFLWFFRRKRTKTWETYDEGATWREVGTGHLIKPGTDRYRKLRETLAGYRVKVAPEPPLVELAEGHKQRDTGGQG
jgi:hypothetical protein